MGHGWYVVIEDRRAVGDDAVRLAERTTTIAMKAAVRERPERRRGDGRRGKRGSGRQGRVAEDTDNGRADDHEGPDD